jgi:hypothetical protein
LSIGQRKILRDTGEGVCAQKASQHQMNPPGAACSARSVMWVHERSNLGMRGIVAEAWLEDTWFVDPMRRFSALDQKLSATRSPRMIASSRFGLTPGSNTY